MRFRPDRFMNLDDFEPAARRFLPAAVFSYISSAVEDGRSIALNRSGFEHYALMTRILRDVSQIDTGVTLFGQKFSAPIGLAPMGLAALSAYRGDLRLAGAAQARNVPAIMSGSSLIRLEEVGEQAPGTWFQAYLPGAQDQIEALIARVKRAGFTTLVLTVDTPTTGNRETDRRAGFSAPMRPSVKLAWQGISHPRWTFGVFLRTLARHGMPHFENNYATRGAPIMSRNILRDFADRGHLNWEHARAIRRSWAGPLILKGVLDARDATMAQEAGFDGVILSNHGGRQLDGAVAPLTILPRVLDRVGDFPVMIDSGFRRGTDVAKALALGARAVFVGRPFGYAAALGGQPGVEHAINLICTELSRNMALMGLTQVAQFSRDCLVEMPEAHAILR